MFDFDEGSIEAAKISLQNLGLILNDIKNVNATVTNEAYESLLEYSISMLQDFEEYTKKVQRLLVK
jgi:predicted aspartyl protease